MKKLLAVLLMLTLVAGAAFAQVSGVAAVRAIPFAGSDADGANIESSVNYQRVQLQAAGETEDGAFGGWIRFRAFDSQFLENQLNTTNNPWETATVQFPNVWGYAYWKPLDILKIQIGANPDGHFGLDGVTRFGFYEQAGDLANVVTEGWKFGDSFYGGYGDVRSMLFTLTPIDGLEINLGIPFNMGENTAGNNMAHMTAQVAYTLADVGKFGLTYQGGYNRDWQQDDAAKMWVYAGLGLIENLSIDVGVGLTFPDDYADGDGTITAPLNAGIGLHYSADAFGVRFRAQGTFGGSDKPPVGDTVETKTAQILVDVLPYYNINENFTAFLSAGLVINTQDPDADRDDLVDFHINPYIRIGNQWSAAFYLGLRIEGNAAHNAEGKAETTLNWSVPVTISWSF